MLKEQIAATAGATARVATGSVPGGLRRVGRGRSGDTIGTATKVTEGIVGSLFIASGGMKLAGGMQDEFERFGYPSWFRAAAGAAEVAAGTGLLGGVRDPRLAAAGARLACGMMVGAIYTHVIRAGDPPLKAAPAGVLLGASAWLAWRNARAVTRPTGE